MDSFEKIMKFVVTPILIMGLFVVMTGILLTKRQAVVSEVSSDWYRGLGISTPVQIKHQPWTPYYGGGAGVDTVVAREDWSLRISTGVDGGWYGAKAVIVDSDFSNSSIAFSVQAYDWGEVEEVLVMFSSDDDLNNYYGIDLKEHFVNPVSGEWMDIVLDKTEFKVIEGRPKWSNVTNMAVKVIPVEGIPTRVWFDEFSQVPAIRSKAIITLAFDDGFASVMEVEKLMNNYEMRGTVYVVPEYLDNDNHLSQVQIDQLAKKGWDISGHGKGDLTELTAPEVDAQLALMRSYLAAGGYQGSEHFAYPEDGYNDSVKSQVLEYFESSRTINGLQQTPEYIYPVAVNAVAVSASTPASEVIALINRAIENDTWLILVWHDLNTEPINDTGYNIEDFAWVVNYIAKSGVEVLPYSLAYERLMAE